MRTASVVSYDKPAFVESMSAKLNNEPIPGDRRLMMIDWFTQADVVH